MVVNKFFLKPIIGSLPFLVMPFDCIKHFNRSKIIS